MKAYGNYLLIFIILSNITDNAIELPNSLESLTLIKYRYKELNLSHNLKYLDLRSIRCAINYNKNIINMR